MLAWPSAGCGCGSEGRGGGEQETRPALSRRYRCTVCSPVERKANLGESISRCRSSRVMEAIYMTTTSIERASLIAALLFCRLRSCQRSEDHEGCWLLAGCWLVAGCWLLSGSSLEALVFPLGVVSQELLSRTMFLRPIMALLNLTCSGQS